MFSYDKNGNIVPNPSKEWTGGDENGKWRDGTSRLNGSVCPAITGEAGYSKEEFDKVNKENKDPELESINSFNDTVKKANEIKDRVLKYVYNIKQERSYNNDLVGIFERYKDIADGDMEVAMNFIKEAYPFNEETESFIRKKFDMPMPNESKEQ